MKKIVFLVLVIVFLNLSGCFKRNETLKEDIVDLKRIGVIKSARSVDKNIIFQFIDSICIDDENSLYIADSALNTIFKINVSGELMSSIGKEGQAPGEFMGRPRYKRLRITYGNDNILYVTDFGNRRISLFTKQGDFLRHFYIPSSSLYGGANASSSGDIYLISNAGDHAISWYNKEFTYMGSILDRNKHFNYPIYEEPDNDIHIIDEMTLSILISRNSEIIAISNIALKTFIFSEKQKLVREFNIDNKRIIIILKNDLKKAISRGRFIAPFRTSLDEQGNVCLLYKSEIYRYTIDGSFIDILRIPGAGSNSAIKSNYCIGKNGFFYLVMADDSIGIFKIIK